MDTQSACPECGTVWHDGRTCQDDFHQILFWEAEFPEYSIVHHFMVLCYHMQHPSLYSPETLDAGKQMLADFLAGMPPSEIRRNLRDNVDSGQRTWKVRGTADAHGVYERPVTWTMTARDVVEAGADRYVESVKTWARSMHDALKASGNV